MTLFYFFIQAFCKLIIDTQTQLQGVYNIQNEDQVITIWLRPQIQFIDFYDISPPCIFTILSGVDGKNVSVMQYSPSQNRSIMLQIENQVQSYIFSEIIDMQGLYFTWLNIDLFIQYNKLRIIKVKGNNVKMPKLQARIKHLYAWQNSTYACLIYNNHQEVETISVLVLQSDSIFKKHFQYIENYRNQIQIKIFGQYSLMSHFIPLVLIRDQFGYLEICQNQSNIIIRFICRTKNNGMEEILFPQSQNLQNYWYSIELIFEAYSISYQVEYQNQTFEGIFYSTFDLIKQKDQEHYIFSLSISTSPNFLNHIIYIINKRYESDKFESDNLCYKNCKICQKLQCLQCEGNLQLETLCLCQLNQEFDSKSATCVDKTLLFQLSDFDYPHCQLGFYLNSTTNKCLLCPKFNEFICSDCLYQTSLWHSQGSCRFQEISQQSFLDINTFLLISLYKIESIQDLPIKVINNNKLIQIIEDTSQIFIERKNYDIRQIDFEICEINYFYDFEYQKCSKKNKGSIHQFNFRNNIEVFCDLGSVQIDRKCQKCQKNCLICQFNNKVMICILPENQFDIDQKQKIHKCKDNCQLISKQDLDQIQEISNNCYIENCKICLEGSCYLCNEDYVADPENYCMKGHYYSEFYELDMINNSKPQLNLDQVLFLTKQIINLNLFINYQDTIQIIYFANNFSSIKSKDNITQNSTDIRGCENFNFYMNNKICSKTKASYQFINNEVKYCPNNICDYDLTFDVDVILSNKHQLLYQNKYFPTMQTFLEGMDLSDISIKNIIINGIVKVYDSPYQFCFKSEMFRINLQNEIKYHLNLDFQDQVVYFPDCSFLYYINFQYTQIKNIITYSPIKFQVDCMNISIFNSTFLGQQPMFIIRAQFIRFQTLEIKNYNNLQNEFIFSLSSQVNIISLLNFENIIISNVKLLSQTLILIEDVVKNGLFKKINIINSQFLDQSIFIAINQQSNLTIQEIIIQQSNFSESKFVKCNGEMIFKKSFILFDNLALVSVLIDKNSIFIQSYQQLQFRRFYISKTNISNSKLIWAQKSLYFKSIIFDNDQLFQSQIIISDGPFIIINKLIMMNINILYSISLFDINNNQTLINELFIINSSYFPNFQPIAIRNIKSIIKLQNIILSNITIDKESVRFEYILVNNKFSIIDIYSKYAKIENILIYNIQTHLQSLIYINSNKLDLNYLHLQGCEIQFYQKQLIIIEQNVYAASHYLTNLIIENVTIKPKLRILQQDDKSIFSLIFINGVRSNCQLRSIIIRDIYSLIEIFVVKVQSQMLKIIQIQAINLNHVGILFQNDSNIIIKDFILYQQTQNQNIPLFQSNSIYQEQLKLYQCKISNLVNSLIQWINKTYFQVQVKKLSINQILLINDIVNIQVQQEMSLSTIFMTEIYLFGGLTKHNQQQFLLRGCNFKISMSIIQIINLHIGLIQMQNCISCEIQKFYIYNGSFNQPLIQLQDQQGNIQIYSGVIKQLDFKQNSLIQINFKKDTMNYFFIIIKNIQIDEIVGGNLANFYEQKHHNQNQLVILKRLLVKQSSFYQTLFTFDIDRVIMQNLILENITCEIFIQQYALQMQIYYALIINLSVNNLFNKLFIQKSELYQTNLIQADNVLKDNQTIQLSDDSFAYQSNQHPIQLSFSHEQYFNMIHLDKNVSKVQFTQNNDIIYVPSGQKLQELQYFDVKTQQHKKIYQQFIIYINYQIENQQDHIISCSLNQFLDGQLEGQFSNYQTFNLTNGKNYLDDFMFIMNPYTNYKFLQNNFNCLNALRNHTIIFNLKILPCQLGEYLYQNRCIICDVNKNLYSVTFRAQHCSIIDIHKMENIKIGQIQLKQNFWRPSYQSNKIEECQIKHVCMGGWSYGDQTCVIGRVGALCKECDIYNIQGQGQFAQNNQNCPLCQPNYFVILKGFAIFSWLLLITYINYNNNRQLTNKYLQYKLMNHRYSDILMRQSVDQISIIIKIFTNYAFVLYLIKDDLNFLSDYLLVTLDFITNPSLVVTSQIDCILVNIYYLDIQYIQLAFRLLIPLVLLSIFYFGYMLLIVLKLLKFQFHLILIITYCIYQFNQQLIFEMYLYNNIQIQITQAAKLYIDLRNQMVVLELIVLIFYKQTHRDAHLLYCSINNYYSIYSITYILDTQGQ